MTNVKENKPMHKWHLVSVSLLASFMSASCAQAPLAMHPLMPNPQMTQASKQRPTSPQTRNDDYYAPVSDLTGAQLLQGLSRLSAKRQKSLGYDQARDVLFGDVEDPSGKNVVVDIYLCKRLTGIDDRASAYSAGMNTEHSWPQSLGAVGVAQSDIHHLFPSDIKANEIRSSYPFGEVEKSLELLPTLAPSKSKIGYDTRGNMVFEPVDSNKGNIARALLYFYMRYAAPTGVQVPNPSLANFVKERDTLIKWHEQDPVDAAEMFRNGTIHKGQGNRNPFIDHPDYVRAIGDFPIN